MFYFVQLKMRIRIIKKALYLGLLLDFYLKEERAISIFHIFLESSVFWNGRTVEILNFPKFFDRFLMPGLQIFQDFKMGQKKNFSFRYSTHFFTETIYTFKVRFFFVFGPRTSGISFVKFLAEFIWQSARFQHYVILFCGNWLNCTCQSLQ